jgi:nitrogen regulatory protein PII
MQMHAKKRIEIILEAPALHRLTDALEKAGVKGYTILPVLAGSGSEGPWSRDGQVTVAGQMVTIIAITDASKVDDALQRIYQLLSRQIGIVTVSDVQVMRPERF